MLIRCPTCASGYDLPAAMLGEGRILRCAHCRDAWVHRPEAEREGAQINAEHSSSRPSPHPAEGRDALPMPRRRWPGLPWRPRGLRPTGGSWAPVRGPAGVPAGVGASLLAAALLLGGSAAVAGKARVVAAFPPSEAVFATLGLPVNLSGLALGELRSSVATGDGPATLTLEGRITNIRPDATPVPALRIAVRDKEGRELYHWTAPAPKARLAAGETVLFRSRLTAPPRDGQMLAVSFAEAAPDRRRLAEAMPPDR